MNARINSTTDGNASHHMQFVAGLRRPDADVAAGKNCYSSERISEKLGWIGTRGAEYSSLRKTSTPENSIAIRAL